MAYRQATRAAVMLAALSLSLTACTQKMVYMLSDGRVPANDPTLSRQFAADSAICDDEMAKSVQGGDHGDGSATRGSEVEQVGNECMAEKGYVAVRQDQAAAKQRELAASAAAKSQLPPPARN